MEIDFLEVTKTPETKWDAVDLLVKTQQNMVEALHIMNSIIENNTIDFKEHHEARIKKFISKFEVKQ